MRKNREFNEYTMNDINELVIDYKGGNEYALSVMHYLAEPGLKRYGRTLSKDDQMIQEAIQDTFMVIAEKVGQLKDTDRFMKWVRVIFRNKIMDGYRRRKRVEEDCHDATGADYHSAFAKSICGKIEFNPESKVLREELIKEVEEAIEMLPATQRVALLAYAYDDKTMQEIAYMMDCPEGTVKSRIYNARRAVRAYVNRFEEKEE